jgi:hypothetical protein
MPHKTDKHRSAYEVAKPLTFPDSAALVYAKVEGINLEDWNRVAQQLGYVPLNFISVEAKGPENNPLVVALYPMNRNEHASSRYQGSELLPFPTYLWMTCSILKATISVFEKDGWISIFQKRLDNDSSLVERMRSAHQSYAKERYSVLDEEHIALLEDKGWVEPIKSYGIAGIRDFGTVKCLHCHYAHYLARPEHGNIIGEWVAELILARSSQPSGGTYAANVKFRENEQL